MIQADNHPHRRTRQPRDHRCPLKNKLEALKPERRAAVEAEADRLHAEYGIQVQILNSGTYR